MVCCSYQYDLNAPGAASQLRITSRRDFNLNVSVSNANMIIQAYASWSNLSHVHKSNQEIVFPFINISSFFFFTYLMFAPLMNLLTRFSVFFFVEEAAERRSSFFNLWGRIHYRCSSQERFLHHPTE